MRRQNFWLPVLLLGHSILFLITWWWLAWAPLPTELSGTETPRLTAVFVDCNGQLIAELPGPDARSHRPVKLAAMGPWIASYVLEREDRRFFQHLGLDLAATVRALTRHHGGASTLTQQLVKMATGRTQRVYWVKLKETLVAFQVEWRWNQTRILEAYLNRAPFGNRLIGVEAASLAYFGKSAVYLTKSEALFLVGLPQSPSRYNPWKYPEAAAHQFEKTVRLLISRGVLTEVDAVALPVIERNLPKNLAPHFVDAIRTMEGFALSRSCLQPGFYKCTLDLAVQKKVLQIMKTHLGRLNRPDISEGSAVLIEQQTGAVRALVGSVRELEDAGGINGALEFRNCGSTLKPFLYLAGIERKIFTAATVFPDTAEAVREIYPDYDPHNFVVKHLGPVRLREALGSSMNVPAVCALGQLGARSVFEGIRSWGVRFDRPMEAVGAGYILGNVGVRLLDLTGAYAGLARGGTSLKPVFYSNVMGVAKRIVSAEATSVITDILCDNDARAYSFGTHSPLSIPGRVALKTGTSAGFRDAWTLGYTSQHSLGVWVGNFNGKPMNQASSIVGAIPLWRSLYDQLLVKDPSLPVSALPKVEVCSLSGLLPSPFSKSTNLEIFLPGTEPLTSAGDWFSEEGGIQLPLSYAGWCASKENHLQARVREVSSALEILSPRKNEVYLLDPILPRAQQQVEFFVNLPRDVRWKLNGRRMESDSAGRVLWRLEEGEWKLEASNGFAEKSCFFTVKSN